MSDEGENKVHTGTDAGHPAGDGPRSDRDIGGPTPDQETGDETGGAHGTKQTQVPDEDEARGS